MTSPRILQREQNPSAKALVGLGALCLCFAGISCVAEGETEIDAPLPEVIVPTDNPTLLEGDATMLALDALQAQLGVAAPASEHSEDRILSRMAVLLGEAATVKQVNEALEKHDAFIVSMRPGFPVLNLKIPVQANVEALETFRQALIDEQAFDDALIAFKRSSNELPAAALEHPAQFKHHATTRAIAAWNTRGLAKQCAPGSFAVMVVDSFQGGTSDPKLTQAGFQMLVGGDGTGALGHGDRVAALISATVEAGAPFATNPAPSCHKFYGVQAFDVDWLDTLLRFRSALDQVTGKAIANLSTGYTPDTGASYRANYAAFYRYLFATEIESGRLLTVSAVGNDFDLPNLEPGAKLAQYDSPMNIEGSAHDEYAFATNANLFPKSYMSDEAYEQFAQNRLVRFGLVGAAPIENNLAVGALDGAGSSITPAGAGASAFSNPGAQLFAPGEGIEVLGGNKRLGTSYASPQVAGLIAYLWALSPELREASAKTTIDLLLATKNLEVATAGDVPIMSAYNAVLSLESGGFLDAQGSPVRLALLDANDNGSFDENDIRYFALNGATSAVDIEQDENETYARADLNGDGQTGIGSKVGFDASIVDSPKFGQAKLSKVTVVMGERQREYDETEMDDRDVLCFYAYSALYTGDEFVRTEALGDTCGENENTCRPLHITCGDQRCSLWANFEDGSPTLFYCNQDGCFRRGGSGPIPLDISDCPEIEQSLQNFGDGSTYSEELGQPEPGTYCGGEALCRKILLQ